MKLIVGLGNPGERYKFSPHNMGFMVVEKIAQTYKTNFKKKSQAKIAEFSLEKEKIILAKPLTFMNLSGEAVAEIMRKRRIKEEDLLVICDDINLSLGKLRIRSHGSDGGHLGLRSIIENLGNQDFARLRIGVGRPAVQDVSQYVLKPFSKEDLDFIERIIGRAQEAVLVFVKEGIDKAMSKFN